MKCHVSRYHIDNVTKKVPQKVLHYIPIIPCLQRLFRCKKIAQFMDYHARNRSQDDVIWMPADGSAFWDMEEKWPNFKEEPRNLRISLAAYGCIERSEVLSNPVWERCCHVCTWRSNKIIINFIPNMSAYTKLKLIIKSKNFNYPPKIMFARKTIQYGDI